MSALHQFDEATMQNALAPVKCILHYFRDALSSTHEKPADVAGWMEVGMWEATIETGFHFVVAVISWEIGKALAAYMDRRSKRP